MEGENNLYKKSENEAEVVYKPLTYEKSKQDRLVAENENGKKECIFLYFSAITANLVMFASACSLVWSSPAFQTLKSTDLEVNPLGVPLTPFQESLIAALPCLGATVGPMLSGKFADVYGRKNALMLLATLKIISYIALSFATNIYVFYLTRFSLGIGVGMCFAVLPLYIGEICEDHNRGKFGCTMGVFATLGVLYTISIAPLLSLKLFTLTCTIPLIFVLVSFILYLPETPVFLASIDDNNNAVKALMKLRNKNRRVAEKDLLEIKQMISESTSSSNEGYAELFKTSALRRGLIICVGLCLFQQFSGINAILAFIGPIFELTGSEISANLSSILVAVVQVAAIFAASALVEKLGRRFLLLFSAVNSSISLIMLGFYFYLKSNEFHYIKSISWLPVTSLIMYIISFNLGLGPVPWALVSEIFPSSVRSTASSLATIFGALTSFSVTFLFPLINQFLGMANCCWLFGGFCAVGTVFIYVIVPETKGKSIVEIQKILSK